jgi:hypothetical protein
LRRCEGRQAIQVDEKCSLRCGVVSRRRPCADGKLIDTNTVPDLLKLLQRQGWLTLD